MTASKNTTITVRVPDGLLNWLDEQVDGIDFRNRTHVIIKAISEYKKNKTSKR
jgi:Arc/MetJ-type ribon-helix-helix transcriptional regulator